MKLKTKITADEKQKIILKTQDLMQRGKVDKAVKELLVLIKLDPKDPSLKVKTADALLKLKRDYEAVCLLRAAGQDYAVDGFYTKALALYTRAYKIPSADQVDILFSIAEMKFRLGMVRDGVDVCKELLKLIPPSDNLKKRRIMEFLVNSDPSNADHRILLANLLYKTGEKTKAISTLIDTEPLITARYGIVKFKEICIEIPEVGLYKHLVIILKSTKDDEVVKYAVRGKELSSKESDKLFFNTFLDLPRKGEPIYDDELAPIALEEADTVNLQDVVSKLTIMLGRNKFRDALGVLNVFMTEYAGI